MFVEMWNYISDNKSKKGLFDDITNAYNELITSISKLIGSGLANDFIKRLTKNVE